MSGKLKKQTNKQKRISSLSVFSTSHWAELFLSMYVSPSTFPGLDQGAVLRDSCLPHEFSCAKVN